MANPKLDKIKELAQILDDSLSREEFLDLFKKVTDFVKSLEPKLLEKVDLKMADEQKKLLEGFKKELGKLSDEANKKDRSAFKDIEKEVGGLIDDIVSETEKKMKQIDEKLSQVKDGVDADEETIVARVIKLVPNPTFDDSKLQAIKNDLIDEVRKNKRIGGGFSKIHFESAYPGSDGQVLTKQADGSWAAENATGGSGSGDVVGPSSSVDNAIARFDGTTGKIIQDYTSGAPTISDTGNITLATGKILAIGSVNAVFSVGTASFYLAGSGNVGSSAASSLGMGFGSLVAVETNGFNVAIGNESQPGVTSGSTNSTVGFKSGFALITGNRNSLFGASAGRAVLGNDNTILGESAGRTTQGNANILIGCNGGRYVTGDNLFVVNSLNQTNAAGDAANSILYGSMNATPSSQTLVTNSAFTATYGMNVPTGQTYKINGTALAYTDITGAGNMLTSTYDAANVAEQLVGLTATQTLSNKTLTAPKFVDLGFIADSNGNEMLQFDQVASAENYIRIINSIAGSGPTLIADGSDTNITLKLYAKGTGLVEVNTGFNVGSNRLYMTGGGLGIVDSGSNEYLKFVQVASAVNEFTITNSATGTGPTLSTTGNDTNIDMLLVAKGSGVVKADGNEVLTTVSTTSALTTVGTLASGNATAIVDAATTSAAGKVELAITSEIDTGTDSTRAMPVDQFVASKRNVRYFIWRFIDSTTDWSADGSTSVGGAVPIPFSGTAVEIYADSDTAGTTGTAVVDVNIAGTTMMGTNKLKWDSTETSTRTYSGTAPAISNGSITAGQLLTVDIDTNHTTKSKGLVVTIGIRQS